MIDCSKKENYLREKARMVKAERGLCIIDCDGCPLGFDNNGRKTYCTHFEKLYPAEAIALVQKWSDEHSQKTYADDFFEKFPNAPEEDERGTPRACRINVYGTGDVIRCDYDCQACWNEIMEVTE